MCGLEVWKLAEKRLESVAVVVQEVDGVALDSVVFEFVAPGVGEVVAEAFDVDVDVALGYGACEGACDVGVAGPVVAVAAL